MIIGRYEQEQGAYITAIVYFPPPVHASIQIPFLVDTGAERSVLSASDFLQLSPASRSQVPLRRPDRMLRGLGGAVDVHLTDAGLAFRHDTGSLSFAALELALLPESSEPGLPSILDRDMLYNGRLTFEPLQRRVLFDLAEGLLR